MSSSDPTSTENAAGSEGKRIEPDDSLEIVLNELSGDGESEPVTVDMAAPEESAPSEAKPEDAPVPASIDAAPTTAEARTETSALVDGPPPMPPREPMPEDFSDAVETALAAGRQEEEALPPLEQLAAEAVPASMKSTQESDVVDADAMVESTEPVTPGPEAIESVLAAPVEPPSDEELLSGIVLPPGIKGAPTPHPTIEIGDADRTVISAMPPVIEPDAAVAPYPPLSWATAPVRKTEIIQRPTLQAKKSISIGTRLRSVAVRQVQTSVVQLAMLVVAASALGAAAMGALVDKGADPMGGPRKFAVPPSKVRIDVATAPRPPEIAPLPAHIDEDKPMVTPAPVTIEPTPRRVARAKPKPIAPPPPAVEAEPPKPAVTAEATPKPAPVKKPAAPAKPRSRRVAQHTDWVDPFGQ